ncbi:tetratricopeptide repeat protein, partial (macronuclear) [Tetrahymena thermophila SB210]
LMKSDLNALTHIDLQLKNCTLSNEQVAQLNNCLVQCQKLESLVLNLNKENISDDQINQLFADYPYTKNFVETGNYV